MPPNNDPAQGNGQEPTRASSSDSGNGQEPATSPVPSARDSGDPSKPAMTLEAALSALDASRRENAKYRTDAKRLAELEAAEVTRQEAQLSEKERFEKQLTDYQTKLSDALLAKQEALVRVEVRLAADKLGINAQLARRILDDSALAYSDAGDPTNVADLLAKAVEDYDLGAVAPGALNGKGTAANGSATTARQPTSIGATPANPARGTGTAIGGWSWELISGLTKEQYETLTPQQRAAMSDFIRRTPRR